jgi:predicted lipoprotein with Yx(FWY)xxD motif
MRRFLVPAGIAVVALTVATSAMSSSPQASSSVTARGSSFGRILFDGRGFALYAFTRDRVRHSACANACANKWPPDIVRRRPNARRGVDASLLGTILRRDGRRQATYAGRPLYYYVGDREPLQVLCQNVREFGGLWLVVKPNGTLVR